MSKAQDREWLVSSATLRGRVGAGHGKGGQKTRRDGDHFGLEIAAHSGGLESRPQVTPPFHWARVQASL